MGYQGGRDYGNGTEAGGRADEKLQSQLAPGQELSRVQILEADILELTSPVQRVCVKERVIKFWLDWLLWVGWSGSERCHLAWRPAWRRPILHQEFGPKHRVSGKMTKTHPDGFGGSNPGHKWVGWSGSVPQVRKNRGKPTHMQAGYSHQDGRGRPGQGWGHFQD